MPESEPCETNHAEEFLISRVPGASFPPVINTLPVDTTWPWAPSRVSRREGDELLTNLLDGLRVSEYAYDVRINPVSVEGHSRLTSYQAELMPRGLLAGL